MLEIIRPPAPWGNLQPSLSPPDRQRFAMFETIVRIFGSDLPSLPRARLTREEQRWLLSAHGHNPLLRARRAGMVAARARLLAGLFLALTPVWMLVEFLTLPRSLWLAVGTARLVIIVPFLAMLWALRAGDRHRGVTVIALFGLFAVPAIFYVWTMQILGAGSGAGMAQAVVATHTFFPLLLVAGLGLFPLTLAESLALSLPIFLARGWIVWQVLAPGEVYAVLGALWFLLLVAAAGGLAAGSQLALLIALLRQSIRDPLTGAFSRASGEELLALEMTIAQRADQPFAVAFIDLDRFKDVNDRHGHDAGDRVLAAAAASIAGSLRTTDALLRWGGEEFMVLMPDTDCMQAMVGLERLRARGFGVRPDGQRQTASIGVAERLADGRADAARLVELADQRMYQA
ncbi:MAG: diguanylate cyclase, partial [Gammaproteobacteria bacterium]|nr:diguanylate cyclase [Gammaproteobacteria bacterium]